jgi:flagellar assembly protein FliH
MTSEFTTRFSEEELDQCQSWSLPDVSSNKLIPSAEKEASDRKKRELKNKKTLEKKPVSPKPQDGEVVEDNNETVKPITAEQLQEITGAAEKEGYEHGHKKGYEEGKVEGYKVGEQEGLLHSKEIIAKQSENLQHIVEALMIPLQNEQKQLQAIMLDMVCQLAKAVVQKELTTDSSHITAVIESALNTIPPGADKFSLFLNSQDIAMVESHLNEQPQNKDKQFIYHADDSLLPGGCRLETRQTIVDCTIERRLEEVIDGFLHKQFSNGVETDLDNSESAKKESESREEKPVDNEQVPKAELVDDSINKSTKNDEDGLSGEES